MVESNKSLSSLPKDVAKLSNLVKYYFGLFFSLVSLFLSCEKFYGASTSVACVSQVGCYSEEGTRRNKLYQSIPSSLWDHVSIPRAFLAVWRRSCVNRRAALGVFVGSFINLKIMFGLLKESNLKE